MGASKSEPRLLGQHLPNFGEINFHFPPRSTQQLGVASRFTNFPSSYTSPQSSFLPQTVSPRTANMRPLVEVSSTDRRQRLSSDSKSLACVASINRGSLITSASTDYKPEGFPPYRDLFQARSRSLPLSSSSAQEKVVTLRSRARQVPYLFPNSKLRQPEVAWHLVQQEEFDRWARKFHASWLRAGYRTSVCQAAFERAEPQPITD